MRARFRAPRRTAPTRARGVCPGPDAPRILAPVPPWRLTVPLALAACGGAASASLTGTSDSGEPPWTTAADTTLPTTASSESDAGFVTMPDVGTLPQCSLYADDCPPDQKCAPYATDGGVSSNSTRCVPLADPPAALEAPCTTQQWSASGLDDCDRGLYCVLYDFEALLGRCVALCIEDPDAPDLVCDDPDARCIGNPDIMPRLCSAGCNPLGDDCPGDQNCYRVGTSFSCLADVSGPGGQAGDACQFSNQCDAGMRCVPPSELFDCDAPAGCCSPFCDTRDPAASSMCPGAPDLACVPLFEPGDGPPLYDWVGSCAVPTGADR